MDHEETQPESIAAAQKREQLKNHVLKAGESFGNYRVVKCMCAGLLVHYYHMQHSRDLHDVTVGIFHHRTKSHDKFRARLESLQKTLASFNDEAIPKILDCTTIDERLCIFLDSVQGSTLSQYFEAHGTPGEQGIGSKAATRIIAQLFGVLGYAHSQGVDHRDLDTELIYVQEDGSIRILGLGIKATMGIELFESIVSASVSPLVGHKTLNHLNSFDVMSPEYKSGVAEDARVDIYGVGFIGYWLLTGRKVESAKYVPPTKLVMDLSPNWNSFFEQALEREQDKRYQSCKMALLGLKDTDVEPHSESSSLVQRQIDRIPVPKQIVERGELATRIYRLFIIGLIGLTLTAICASFLKEIYTEEVIRPTSESAPQQLSVEPKILAEQSIKLGEISQIDAPLPPLPATVTVHSQPSGASIVMNKIERGTTPLSLAGVIAGEPHLFEARLQGYRTISRGVELKPGAEMTIDFGELEPLSGALRIDFSLIGQDLPEPSTVQDELKVVMDDGAFPWADPALDFVPVGERRVRLEHPLYASQELTIEVEDRGSYTLNFELSPRPARVQLQILGNMEAEVRVNQKPVTLAAGGILVPAYQEVEFELSIRNYLTMLRSFKLAPNETFVWDVSPTLIPGPAEGQSWTVPYFGILFAWIPAGQFEMGSPLPEHARLPNEGPWTPVRFTRGFWAGVHEVTQAQYSEIIGQNPSQFESPARPVETVSWEQAKVFCELLTSFERDAGRLPTGYVYRLPTEAEWEYAARAGTTSPYFFGVEADASDGHFRGVYPRDREGGLRVPVGSYGTATVGRYQANAFGLFDVHGNVREWTLDVYNGRLPGEALVDPTARTIGRRIAVRGGGWEDTAARVRSAVREEVNPELVSNAMGFRVVLAPEL